MDRPDRSVWIIGGGVLAVVLLAVVVIVALGASDPASFAPDTPEHALQQYLDAVHDGDDERALTFLSEDARNEMPSNVPGRDLYCAPQDGRGVTIDSVELAGDRATVTVEVEEFSGSGLEFDRYSWEYPIRLVREDGAWKIDDP